MDQKRNKKDLHQYLSLCLRMNTHSTPTENNRVLLFLTAGQTGASCGTPLGNAPSGVGSGSGSGCSSGSGPRRMNANKTGSKDLVGPKTGECHSLRVPD